MLPPWKRKATTFSTTESRRSNRGDPTNHDKLEKGAIPPVALPSVSNPPSAHKTRATPAESSRGRTRQTLSSSPLSAGPSPEPVSAPTTMESPMRARGSLYNGQSSRPVRNGVGNSNSKGKGKGKEERKVKVGVESGGAGQGKGKEKAQVQGERRVLPARVRRAAGGGAEGVRDLEEMIIDWLERYGEVNTTPPDSLRIHFATSPLDMLDPTVTQSNISIPSTPPVTSTPTRPMASGSNVAASPRLVLEGRERIETPSWVMVGAGEDDREEAREEMELYRGRRPVSPVKRLRKALVDGSREDTSDAHYQSLHKKYEAFERRQRIRERETLTFERHRLRSRMELLRNMSETAWGSLVLAVMRSRDGERGKDRVEEEGFEWLRRRLIGEGKEVLKRYDQLLPVEPRKPKVVDGRMHTLTPDNGSSEVRGQSYGVRDSSVDSEESKESPAPVPARVAALKDKKRRASSPLKRVTTHSTPDTKAAIPVSRSERFLRSRPSMKRKRPSREEDDEREEEVDEQEEEEDADYNDGGEEAGVRRKRSRASVPGRQDSESLPLRTPRIIRSKQGDGPSSNLRRRIPPEDETLHADDEAPPPATNQPDRSILATEILSRPTPLFPSETPEVIGYTSLTSTPLGGDRSPRKAGSVEQSGWNEHKFRLSREEDMEMASVEAAVVI